MKIIIASIIASSVLFAGNVAAIDVFDEQCNNIGGGDSLICKDENRNQSLVGSNGIFNNIVNALLFIVGALSVVMLIYGGIRYTASAGNANSVTAAKNTIIYAIVGLVVAFLAFAIINWVITRL